MKSSIICVQLALLVTVAVLGQQQQDKLQEELRCSVSGFQCLDKTTYAPCAARQLSHIVECEPGLVCSPREPSGIMCIPTPPVCNATGRFRFPGDCRRWYACIRMGPANLYNLYEGFCDPGHSLNLTEGACTRDEGCGSCDEETPMVQSLIDPQLDFKL
ncbi:hypothetical protein B566_EDAN001977 [Ephemera danica]|nr:hypothetical protein B566_EDAN001977 [Ephemera danica]